MIQAIPGFRNLVSITSNLSSSLSSAFLCVRVSLRQAVPRVWKEATGNSSLHSTSLKILEETEFQQSPISAKLCSNCINLNKSLRPGNGWNIVCLHTCWRKCRQPVSNHMDWDEGEILLRQMRATDVCNTGLCAFPESLPWHCIGMLIYNWLCTYKLCISRPVSYSQLHLQGYSEDLTHKSLSVMSKYFLTPPSSSSSWFQRWN